MKALAVFIIAVLYISLAPTVFVAANVSDSSNKYVSITKEEGERAEIGVPFTIKSTIIAGETEKDVHWRLVLPEGIAVNSAPDSSADGRIDNVVIRSAVEVFAEMEQVNSGAKTLSDEVNAAEELEEAITQEARFEINGEYDVVHEITTVSESKEVESEESEPKGLEEAGSAEDHVNIGEVEKRVFSESLMGAIESGETVLEYRMGETFTGSLDVSISLVANEHSWSEGQIVSLISAYNATINPSPDNLINESEAISTEDSALFSGTIIEEIDTFSFEVFGETPTTIGTATGTSTFTMGGNSEIGDHLKVVIYNTGRQAEFARSGGTGSNYNQHQWYSQNDNGFSLYVDGTVYATNYIHMASSTTEIPVGTIYKIDDRTCYVEYVISHNTGGSITLRTTFHYSEGARSVNMTFSLANNTGKTLSDVRLIFGGDAYFSGADKGYGHYNETAQMLYITKDATSGMFALIADETTPYDMYFGGTFSSGRGYARTGKLPNEVVSTYSDKEAYIGWCRTGITDGSGFEVKSNISFPAAGELMVSDAVGKTAPTNTVLSYTFSLINVSASSETVTLSTSSSNGWKTNIIGSTTATVASGEEKTVYVELEVPDYAVNGETDTITFTATNASGKAYEGVAITTVNTTHPALTITTINQTDSELTVRINFLNSTKPHITTIMLKNGNGSTLANIPSQTGSVNNGDVFVFDISSLALDNYYIVEASAQPDIPYPAKTTIYLESLPVFVFSDAVITEGDFFNPLSGVILTDKGKTVAVTDSYIASNNVDTTTPGRYTVSYMYTNEEGIIGTATRNVFVEYARPILDGPVSLTVSHNNIADFYVSITGAFASPIEYQWQVNDGKGWKNIPGAAFSTYSSTANNNMDGYTYRVIVSNGKEADSSLDPSLGGYVVTSSEAALTVAYHTVTYNGNGHNGGIVPADMEVFSPDNKVYISDLEPTRIDYSFKEWNTDRFGTGIAYAAGDVFTINSNISLYAIWGVRVTYSAGSATGVTGIAPTDSTIHYSGESITATSSQFSRDGFSFVGWAPTDGSSLATVIAGETFSPTTNITLYPVWIGDVTVSFNSNGGSSVSGYLQMVPTDTVIAPKIPTKTGLTFVGWYEDEALTKPYLFNNEAGTNSFTLYAKWGVSVTYGMGTSVGGSVPTDNTIYSIGEKIVTKSNSENLERPGYVLVGWTDGVYEYKIRDTFTATKDVTLVPVWRGDVTISYDSNGGTVVNSCTGMEPSYITVEPTSPIKPEFIFAGWYTDADLAQSYAFGNLVGTDSLTLYAKWQVTLSYDANDGSGYALVAIQDDVESNVSVSDASLFNSGHSFQEWNTKADGTGVTYMPGSRIILIENTTLYAIWVGDITGSCSPAGTESGTVIKDNGTERVSSSVNTADEDTSENVNTEEITQSIDRENADNESSCTQNNEEVTSPLEEKKEGSLALFSVIGVIGEIIVMIILMIAILRNKLDISRWCIVANVILITASIVVFVLMNSLNGMIVMFNISSWIILASLLGEVVLLSIYLKKIKHLNRG